MAKTSNAPEQDSAPVVPDGDILPENQQHEQPEAPPPEMSDEEAVILEAEGKAALFEKVRA